MCNRHHMAPKIEWKTNLFHTRPQWYFPMAEKSDVSVVWKTGSLSSKITEERGMGGRGWEEKWPWAQRQQCLYRWYNHWPLFLHNVHSCTVINRSKEEVLISILCLLFHPAEMCSFFRQTGFLQYQLVPFCCSQCRVNECHEWRMKLEVKLDEVSSNCELLWIWYARIQILWLWLIFFHRHGCWGLIFSAWNTPEGVKEVFLLLLLFSHDYYTILYHTFSFILMAEIIKKILPNTYPSLKLLEKYTDTEASEKTRNLSGMQAWEAKSIVWYDHSSYLCFIISK